jgi:hypothetical protein
MTHASKLVYFPKIIKMKYDHKLHLGTVYRQIPSVGVW